MLAVGYAIKFLPIFFIVLVYFVSPHPLSGLAIILLMIYGKIVSADDVSRIEHKVDVIFEMFKERSTDALRKAYSNLHQTAWDHTGVFDIGDDLLTQGKASNKAETFSAVLSKLAVLIMSFHFIFRVLRQFVF